MKFKREVLLDALAAVTPGLALNATVDVMQNVLFAGNNLIAFNEQTGILIPFETDFEASVNHGDLFGILNKLEAPELEITFENGELLISSDSTKAGLLITSTEDIDENLDALLAQIPNETNDLEWSVLPTDFLSGMSLCLPAADSKRQLQTLSCLYANGTELICSDNDRVSNYTLNGDLDTTFFIRAGLIKELSKFAVTTFCATSSWVFFRTEDDVKFAAKKVFGKPMEMYLTLFDGFKGKVLEIPEGLKEVVNAASVMATDNDTKPMDVVIEKNEMVCTSQNERGWITKRIPIKSTSKNPIEFQVSAAYLQQILDLPDLKMIVGEGKSLFTSGNFRHVLVHRAEE
jgi:hypothetical protein